MNLAPKSRTTSAVLTILLGPLGLLYASPGAAVLLIIVALVSAPTVIGPLLCWIGAIAWGDHATQRHNESLERLIGSRQDRQPEPEPEKQAPPPTEEARQSDGKAYDSGLNLEGSKGRQSKSGPSVMEVLGYIVVAVFLVLILPDWLGKPEDQSALYFYLDMFGLID